MSTRRLLGALGLVAALVFANAQLFGLERLMGGAGRQVLMPLAPIDPLSFVQGRYVALHYRLDGSQSLIVTPVTVDGEVVERWRMWPRTGRMAVLVDADGKAAAIRLHDETAKLAPGEVLWRYRKDGVALNIGSEAWFCPEERCAEFERDAAYGVFKVDVTGRVILVGLADAGGAIMATPPPRWWTGQRVDATATPTAP